MTTFDQTLSIIKIILGEHAAELPKIGDLLINRDLNGRVRLIVSEALSPKERGKSDAKQCLASIIQALAERLGPHAYPIESAILYENDLLDAQSQAPSFTLENFPQVRVVDRLATEGDWARISAESTGAPRIVFFSIKGGVGRSTALAATAWSLAQSGKRVLVLDLDLESPGLSSALLPEDYRPAFGITDWLVEDLVDNGAAVLGEMVSISPLSHDGEILVVPAHGSDPGEYINKLGRVWMPKVHADGSREGWSARLSRLIGELEQSQRPDVILLDSRAGIDEVASSCVTDLGAGLVLLFAIDGEQTWTGYRILFEHWQQYDVAPVIRERLKVVGAMLPDDERRTEYFDGLRERSHELFLEALYDEIPAGEIGEDCWTFDVDDITGQHYPLPIGWNRGFFALQSLHERMGSLDQRQVDHVFAELIQYISAFVQQKTRTDA